MRRCGALVLSWLAVSAGPAIAWDNFGHMEVAAVAWSKLNPSVQVRAIELLKRNPLFDSWVQGVAPEDRDKFAFMLAATWPDIIKSASDYVSDGPNNGNSPPPGPEASQNIGYVDHFMHKYWHFIDEPFTPDGTPLAQPATPNAQTQIAAFRATLPSTSNATDDVRSYDLAWLLHLVGDVHQPLHATSRFTRDLPNGDEGGNSVKIHCGSDCRAPELHRFWDDVLGPNNTTPQDAAAAADQLPEPDPGLAGIADEKVWIDESFKAAQTDVYVPPIGISHGPFSLNDQYKSNARVLAQQRVALAGARLANLLNDALQ